MNIGSYTYEEFIEEIKSFHGSVAPGIIAGGIMVNMAEGNLPEGEFFDVICETGHCLPDAVQLLTPCTMGNGWLKIVNTGRFAMTFYNKYTGDGIRAFLDVTKLEEWPHIRSWFLGEKPKSEQNLTLILKEFQEAGAQIFTLEHVRVKPSYIASGKKAHNPSVICPSCGEAFKSKEHALCPACLGEGPYVNK